MHFLESTLDAFRELLRCPRATPGYEFASWPGFEPDSDECRNRRLCVLAAFGLHAIILFGTLPWMRSIDTHSDPFIRVPESVAERTTLRALGPMAQSETPEKPDAVSAGAVRPSPAPELSLPVLSVPIPIWRPVTTPRSIVDFILPEEIPLGDADAPASRRAKTEENATAGPHGPRGGPGKPGVFSPGEGVTLPVALKTTLPAYTGAAIQSKAQGVVLLQAIVRADGRVDSFQVLRGLGFGLEEAAIREIAEHWKFRPGTFQGEPVDVFVTIEVQFNLR